MSDVRAHIELAKKHLTPDDLRVWQAKHVYGYGRHAGSFALGITAEQYRYALARADRIMKPLLEEAA